MFIKGPGVVRTGDSAILAADTSLFVDQNHSAGVMVRSVGRTHLCAGGVLAVLALDRQTPASPLRLLLLSDATDEALSLGKIVPLVAGFHAGATARALVKVDDQGVFALYLLQCLGQGNQPAPDRHQEYTA
jgi:hypothetical protein